MSIFFHYGDFKKFIKTCPITVLFILTNTIFLILTLIYGGFEVKEGNFITDYGLVPFFVTHFNQYYRLLTAMFLHGSISHFVFNIFFGILIIGAGLERLIGSVRYFFIYMLSGLLSSGFVVLSGSRSLQESLYLTIGASGAIYGVMGTFLFIVFYRNYLLNYSDKRYVGGLLVINLLFTFSVSGISKMGHLGGLLSGFILAPLFLLSLKREY